MKKPPRAILIVDDDDQDRKIILRLLQRSGCSGAAEARSAAEAEKAAASGPVDLAIVDTVLPDAEGFEVCRHLRALHPAAAIIMITGLIDALDAGRARKAGADDYVVKTADGAPLLEALAALLKDER